MKGFSGGAGLLIAGVLGVLAVALNWFYLQNKAKNFEAVSFLAVSEDISNGQPIEAGKLVEVRIPQAHAENLKEAAFLYDDLESVTGFRATRDYKPGDLIFKRDHRTPPGGLTLAEDEAVIWIRVDNVSFEPELVDPGYEIWFDFPSASDGPSAAQSIGPFEIKSIGNRFYSKEVMKAYKVTPTNPKLVGLVVKKDQGQLELKARTLLSRLQTSGGGEVNVWLSSKKS